MPVNTDTIGFIVLAIVLVGLFAFLMYKIDKGDQ